MASPAYDLASYLETLGHGTVGTSIFVNAMPESEAQLIAVFQYGGARTDLGMGDGTGTPNTDALEHPHLQISVRPALSSGVPQISAAETKIYDIYKALDGRGPVTINSVEWTFMRALQPPFVIGRDEKERSTYVFNLEAQKRRS